jgi:plastocyanin
MTQFRLVLALLAAMALLALTASVGSAKSAAPVLLGQDGPGFTITLKQGGKVVKSLKAGTYTIKVADKSNIHNFHLKGPGVNKLTSVGKVYTVTWTVKLKKGKYTYVCDPHASLMNGSFTVK